MELREAFIGRKGRFKLLELSLEAACFAKAAPLLEVGCATGEGSAHLAELGYTYDEILKFYYTDITIK